MPTIYKPEPKPPPRRKERQKLYQMKQWRELSKWFIMYHPLCQKCEEKGIITPSQHCHHILSPFDYGLSHTEQISRLLDEDNLMALCADCHAAEHAKKNIQNIDIFSF